MYNVHVFMLRKLHNQRKKHAKARGSGARPQENFENYMLEN